MGLEGAGGGPEAVRGSRAPGVPWPVPTRGGGTAHQNEKMKIIKIIIIF